MTAAATIHTGDALAVLRTLPDCSVHCCWTSPPYWGLRDYGVAGQIGLEPTPEAYVARMVEVFREVRRVLRDDGTLWLNVGDSYCSHAAEQAPQTKDHKGSGFCGPNRAALPGLKPKDIVGIPWRLAFALQADGWYLRQDIIWHKPNPMPESVQDRCCKSHEYLFLLSKSARYWFDQEAIKEPAVYADGCNGSSFTDGRDLELYPTVSRKPRESVARGGFDGKTNAMPGREAFRAITQTRNRRSVWTIATEPSSLPHFAMAPTELVRPCVLAGTSERGCCPACAAAWVRVVEKGAIVRLRGESTAGPKAASGEPFGRMAAGYSASGWTPGVRPVSATGWRPGCDCPPADPVPCTVLDPFAGASTTGVVAMREGRNYIGIELNPKYAAIGRERCSHYWRRDVRPSDTRADHRQPTLLEAP